MKTLSLFSILTFLTLHSSIHAASTETLVANAIKTNPEIRYYEAEIAAARAGKITATQIANPEFSSELAGKVSKSRAPSAKENGLVFRAEISQTFDFPGRIALRKAIAERDIALAELGLLQFKALLSNEVRTRTGDYSLLQRKVDATREVRQRLEELIEVLVQRDTGSVSARLERRILEATLLTSDRALTDATKAAVEARVTLNLLCGLPSDNELNLDAQTPVFPPVPELAALKAQAAKNNFQLQQQRLQLARQGLKIDLTKSERWGNFSFGPYFAGESLTDEAEKEGGIVFSIPLPLWNKNKGNIAAEEARQMQAEAMIAATLRDLERDLTIERSKYASELEALSHWRPETEKEFQQAAAEADHHYRLGAVPATTYVEMQRGYLDALDTLIETRRQAWSHRMQIERLTGAAMEGAR